MNIFGKPLDDITKEDIEKLIDNGETESKTLDYKAILPKCLDNTYEKKDKEKVDFLKDVSAFANTSGGTVIYGVSEKVEDGETTGIPDKAIGLENFNEEIIRKLEDLIKQYIVPNIYGMKFEPVDGFPKGKILVMEIPQSWNSPHMIDYKNTKREYKENLFYKREEYEYRENVFYYRGHKANIEMDYEDIKNAFILSEGLGDKMRNFRYDRLGRIITDETPVKLKPNPKVVLHIFPISAFKLTKSVDLSSLKLEENNKDFLDIVACELKTGDPRFNFDGLFMSDKYKYTQVFRNGCIELVNSSLITSGEEEKIYFNRIEKGIPEVLNACLKMEQLLNITPPLFVMLSLLNVKSYKGWVKIGDDPALLGDPIEKNDLNFLEVQVNDYNEKAEDILDETFNILWESSGLSREVRKNYNKSKGR